MGLTERQAGLCSTREYFLRLEGWERAKRAKYELLRWEAWRLMAPYYKKGQAPTTPQDYLRFPWEEPTEEEIASHKDDSNLTQGQVDELNRLVALHMENVNRKKEHRNG